MPEHINLKIDLKNYIETAALFNAAVFLFFSFR